jgi:hypothetical protein
MSAIHRLSKLSENLAAAADGDGGLAPGASGGRDGYGGETAPEAARPFQWAEAINGNFNTAADWTGGRVPGASNDALLNAAGAAFAVSATTSETVRSLHTTANATLHVNGGTFSATTGTGLGVNAGLIVVGQGATFAAGGKLNNRGRIVLNGSDLDILSDTTLTGGGTVVLNRSGGPAGGSIDTGTTAALVNLNDTIRGDGYIGGPGLTLDNQAGGVIVSVGGGIYLDSKTNAFRNAGLIEVSTSSGLELSGKIDNSGSIIGGSNGDIFFGYSGSILSTVINTGVIRFSSTASITIEKTTFDDSGGGVLGPFADVKIDQGVVLGGHLTISAAGTMVAYGYDHIRTSTLTNFGAIRVEMFQDDEGILQVQGVVANDGSILIQSLPGAVVPEARLILGANTTFTGGGAIDLIYGGASSISSYSRATLTNVNNVIEGSGAVGSAEMTLVNQASGVIDAKYGVNYDHLDLSTGTNVITNAGVIEATRGYLSIGSPITNSGTLSVEGGAIIDSGSVVGSGSAVINSGMLSFGSAFNESVKFTGTSGLLKLAHAQAFTATITGLPTNGAASLDLTDITFTGGVTKASFVDNGHQSGGLLTVTDGVHIANINLLGDYVSATFVASSDGHGGTDVAAGASETATVSPAAFISAMAGLGAAAAGQMPRAEIWAAREPLLTSPRANIA